MFESAVTQPPNWPRCRICSCWMRRTARL